MFKRSFGIAMAFIGVLAGASFVKRPGFSSYLS